MLNCSFVGLPALAADTDMRGRGIVALEGLWT